jgi:hypothetical protein
VGAVSLERASIKGAEIAVVAIFVVSHTRACLAVIVLGAEIAVVTFQLTQWRLKTGPIVTNPGRTRIAIVTGHTIGGPE